MSWVSEGFPGTGGGRVDRHTWSTDICIGALICASSPDKTVLGEMVCSIAVEAASVELHSSCTAAIAGHDRY